VHIRQGDRCSRRPMRCDETAVVRLGRTHKRTSL
jgi:hypothetical protein